MTTPIKLEESIGGLLNWATGVLNDGSFENPALEAEFLLGGLMEQSPTDLLLARPKEANEEIARHYRSLIEKRKLHVPAAYLLGRKNFMGFELDVNPFVLIPRPETELLVEWAHHLARRIQTDNVRILDIGTGSGCIAIALAKLLPKALVAATDVSPEALQTAKRNAGRLFLDGKVRFLSSDLYAGLDPEFIGDFDMIVANPPYVTRSEYDSLEVDVKQHEPRRALLGGEDGFEVISPLIEGAGRFLKPGGLLLLEIGYRQANAVQDQLKANGFFHVQVRKDFSGHDRMVAARRG